MFDETRPQDRSRLLEVLQEKELEAREFEEDGDVHVVVPLLDLSTQPKVIATLNPELRTYLSEAGARWSQETYLFIATHHDPEQAVGLMYEHPDADREFTFENWQPVNTLEEAIEAFENFWDQRDSFLMNFTGRSAQEKAKK